MLTLLLVIYLQLVQLNWSTALLFSAEGKAFYVYVCSVCVVHSECVDGHLLV